MQEWGSIALMLVCVSWPILVDVLMQPIESAVDKILISFVSVFACAELW